MFDSRSLLFFILLASLGNAIPSAHRVRSLDNGVKITTFQRRSNYQTSGGLLDIGKRAFEESSIEEKTISAVASQLELEPTSIVFKSGYHTDDGTAYGYAKQSHNGIPIKNAVANVAFKDSKISAFGHSFVDASAGKVADSTPLVDVNSAIERAEDALQGKKNEVEPVLEYLTLEDGSLALVYAFQVRNEDASAWYEAYIDAHTGELISVADFVSHASYKVLPIWKQVPADGLETVVDPQNLASSPAGWHGNGTTTEGNNCLVYIRTGSNTTSESSPGLNFDYTYDFSVDPEGALNPDAARTSAFYLANSHHDTMYLYGFTEGAFNMQNDNFGKGGLGNDRMNISIYDSWARSFAFTVTPPDGQSGFLRTSLYDFTNPRRPAEMEVDLITHELTHFMSGRTVGGGTGTCLQEFESAILNEAWSDAVADWFTHTGSPEIHDFVFIAWVGGEPPDGRANSRGPYSTSNTTFPLLYSNMPQQAFPHYMGSVSVLLEPKKARAILNASLSLIVVMISRANVLHNLYAELVTANGWSSTARTDPSGTKGNVVWLHLLVDSFALLPCNPLILQARDAMIQADANRYGGAHRCLMWKVFASRGFGVDAHAVDPTTYVDGFGVPTDC
ncbi:hypothetical protein V5O48_012679 [Marasmius crinis-equi]|uniref:Extracellular metalloproteinase n=1 Tax=Marasmius crinis-equi TaxID=585013 RepID=A0ABR3F2Q1_9AGAR